jgi:hypothetical protein
MSVKLRVESEYKDKGLKDARKDVGAFGGYAAGVFKKLAAAFVGIFAFNKIKNFIGSSITAFAAQEKATEQLAQALNSAGESTEDYIPKLNAVASALQTIARVEDDVILQTMAVGSSMGIAAENLDEAVSAAVAFNKTFGMDMQAAMKGIALAFRGNTAQLGKYVPALRGITDAGEAYNAIMALTNNLLKEQAGLSGTSIEKVNAIRLAWGEVKEGFGELFITSGFVTSALDNVLLTLEDIQSIGFRKWIEDTFPALDGWISRLENVGDVVDYLKHKPTANEIIGSPFGGISEADVLSGRTFESNQSSGAFAQSREDRRGELLHQRRMRQMEILRDLRMSQSGLAGTIAAPAPDATTKAASRSLSVGDLFELAGTSFTKNKPDGSKGNEYRVIVENAEEIGGLSEE